MTNVNRWKKGGGITKIPVLFFFTIAGTKKVLISEEK